MKRAAFLLLFLFALPVRADTVILVIGDGMGIEAMKRAHEQGYPWTGFPHFTTLDTANPICGIPDSASAATAIATGHHTEKRMLGVLPDGTPVPSLAEEARDRGLAVGLVTTDRLTGATPAAFYAHLSSRWEHQAILPFLLRSRFDVLIGGGRAWLTGESVRRAGYDYFTAVPTRLKKRSMVLIADQEAPFALDDPAGARMLPWVQLAVRFLDSLGKDYFLLVENGTLDEAAHQNDAKRLQAEMDHLNEVVSWLVEQVLRHPRTTLLLTSDHETGGFNADTLRFATREHTADPVVLLSTHPLPAEARDQTDLNRFIRKLLFPSGP
jgi:alkaline phosphatase